MTKLNIVSDLNNQENEKMDIFIKKRGIVNEQKEWV